MMMFFIRIADVEGDIRAIRPSIGMKWYITHWLLRTFKSSSSILKSPTIKTTFQHFCVQHFSNIFRKLFISLNAKRCFGHEILALCRLCQYLSTYYMSVCPSVPRCSYVNNEKCQFNEWTKKKENIQVFQISQNDI